MIRRSLAELLNRGNLYDPELEKLLVTVSEVRISPDLKVATVFVLPLGGDKKKEAIEALSRSKHEIRKVIAKSLNLKYAPDFRFIIDETFDQIDKTEQLLNQTKVKSDLGKSN